MIRPVKSPLPALIALALTVSVAWAQDDDEAEQVALAAAASGRVVMEAFHYRYHPLAEQMREIAQGGRLGEIERIETWMCVPLPIPGDIRYRYELAGGATMDVGSYAIHMLRTVAACEPEVIEAKCGLSSPNVDRWMRAHFRLPNGGEGIINCSLFSSSSFSVAARQLSHRDQCRTHHSGYASGRQRRVYYRHRLANHGVPSPTTLCSYHQDDYEHQIVAFDIHSMSHVLFPVL